MDLLNGSMGPSRTCSSNSLLKREIIGRITLTPAYMLTTLPIMNLASIHHLKSCSIERLSCLLTLSMHKTALRKCFKLLIFHHILSTQKPANSSLRLSKLTFSKLRQDRRNNMTGSITSQKCSKLVPLS